MTREELLQKVSSTTFDLAVIGGGITGAGIALDAAARGLRVALLEKNDFAYGTSSRSTKLIHGGLRYLKQLEFGLVKEVGSERAVVHRLAPHLVIPEKMLLPLYEKRGLGSTLTSIGLKLYDWLAGVKREDQRRMLTRRQTLRQEPLLKDDGVKGGAIYAEYRTDDARLTIEIIKTAVQTGAIAINYAEAIDFQYTDEHISGLTFKDKITQQVHRLSANTVVNAAGPWVDQLRAKDNSLHGKRLHLTKGVHIVIPRAKLPVHQSIYFDVGDGRMIFAIPRERITYVGTTDTDYQGDIDQVATAAADADYLIRAVNQTLGVTLQRSDIESSWAGLRPLIHEPGKGASQLSRKDEIFESPSGLISIAGGKLTGYRKMAERVVDLVIRIQDGEYEPCTTEALVLTSSPLRDVAEVEVYLQQIEAKLKSRQLADYAYHLVHTYGRGADEILSRLEQETDADPLRRLSLAELEFCLANEFVVSASDFFVRRTGWLFFDMPRLRQVMEPCLDRMKTRLSWSESTRQAEYDHVMKLISSAVEF